MSVQAAQAALLEANAKFEAVQKAGASDHEVYCAREKAARAWRELLQARSVENGDGFVWVHGR